MGRLREGDFEVSAARIPQPQTKWAISPRFDEMRRV